MRHDWQYRFRGACALVLACGLVAALGPAKGQEAPPQTKMAPYTETIPGTTIKFDMVPIAGGKFIMGSPDDEENRGEDEGPTHEVQIPPFWMGTHEVTWDEYDEFAFSFDLKRKKREGTDPVSQPETEKLADVVTRPTPPY
ncbi:MAG: SUMF1/EgtB/PvdO family nonheme iron enzyme, partial [Isosphaeraceae bacterium]